MRKIVLGLFAVLAIFVTAAPAQAGIVTVTDCDDPAVVKKVGGFTVVSFPADEVIIRCALVQLPGAGDGIKVIAHSITVDGPGGGSVVASGKGKGLQLLAGDQPLCGSGDLTATIAIDGALIENTDNNGNIIFASCGHVSVNSGGGSMLKAGENLEIDCFATGCTMEFLGARLEGKPFIDISADDDITIAGSTFVTNSPRDYIKIVSRNGDVLAGGAGGGGQDVCVPPNQQFPIVISDPAQYVEFCENNCDCEQGGNSFDTGVEGNLLIDAEGIIDLQNACMYVAEEIKLITAVGLIDLRNAEIRNDFGKTGQIIVLAAGGAANIMVQDAVIVDGGKAGGADDPNDVASLNNNITSVPNPDPAGSCATSPTCPFKGGAAKDIGGQARIGSRGATATIVGTAACDM